jgi:hypothetical protein
VEREGKESRIVRFLDGETDVKKIEKGMISGW